MNQYFLCVSNFFLINLIFFWVMFEKANTFSTYFSCLYYSHWLLLLPLLFKIWWSCFPFLCSSFPDVISSLFVPFSRNVLCLVENKHFLIFYLLSCRNIIFKKNGCFLIFSLIIFFWIAENFSSQRFSFFCTSLQRQICVYALLRIKMDSLK